MVSYSPDGGQVIAIFDDKTARLWKTDGSDKNEPLTFRIRDETILYAGFDEAGKHVVVASNDGVFHTWSLSPHELRAALEHVTPDCRATDLRVSVLPRSDTDARRSDSACEGRAHR
ncbi:High-affnity carbon uptake protein Hat/HatR [Minicystis rosea]|nr:High-affnity carbon uptake protein Hat/HatR [Minicystis rosea]